jgi:uncharacterized protein YlxW (UPF0749 family)
MDKITNEHLHEHIVNIENQVLKLGSELILIKKQNKKIMATLAELQQAVADLQTSVDTKQQAIADAIKALEDQIANNSGTITEADLQPIVDSLKATQADVDSTPTA